jgi:Cullin family
LTFLIIILGYDPEFGKGEDMFKDLALSRDLMEEFDLKCSRENMNTGGLSVNVLQYSGWPISRRKEGESEIELPTEVNLFGTHEVNLHEVFIQTRRCNQF